jgi:hypothetical protein
MKWQDLLKDSVKGNAIKASSLRRIPQLKSCPYWDRALFLGTISYRVALASYDGGLVNYGGRIYYVSRSQIEALRPYVRWNQKKRITVIEA